MDQDKLEEMLMDISLILVPVLFIGLIGALIFG
jgi:hypothetical protein